MSEDAFSGSGESIRLRTIGDSLENRRIANEAEIEVSPAMIDAGVYCYLHPERTDTEADLVRRIFLAMRWASESRPQDAAAAASQA